jgi:hypothetical protein
VIYPATLARTHYKKDEKNGEKRSICEISRDKLKSTIDFRDPYRLWRLSTFKNFIDFRLSVCVYVYRMARKIPRFQANWGIFFMWSVVGCHFVPFRDLFGRCCGYVTEGNTQAILEGVHGVFKEGARCLYW